MLNKYLKNRNNRNIVIPTDSQIESWLLHHGIEYKDKGNQFRVCNPDGDTKYCMSISKDKALVHDFRPNHQQYDGTFISFVSSYKSISIREAITEICGDKPYTKQIKEEDQEEYDIEHDIELPSGSKPFRDVVDSKLYRLNLGYLINERGLDKDVIMKANIHYLGTEIIVPYYQFGILVFYQSRRQMDKVFNFPKSSERKAGDFLYGFDNVEPSSEVIVVESIFNALSMRENSVATGGASLKDGQLRLLKALNPHTITLAADNDEAGRESVCKNYNLIRKQAKEDLFKDIYFCLPPFSKNENDQMDWNDMKQVGIDPKKYIYNNRIKMSMQILFNKISGKEFK